MNFTPRALLLLAAIVLFVVALFSDLHQGDFLAIGLACVAAAFVVDELGVSTSFGSRRD
ncbi:MAG TPA: hypothetical protein VK278_09370 [Gaiellaceae bacterium]|nr:hypothetical protein [Gaiellaceae bacterium]